jgi:hypothetical protein
MNPVVLFVDPPRIFIHEQEKSDKGGIKAKRLRARTTTICFPSLASEMLL